MNNNKTYYFNKTWVWNNIKSSIKKDIHRRVPRLEAGHKSGTLYWKAWGKKRVASWILEREYGSKEPRNSRTNLEVTPCCTLIALFDVFDCVCLQGHFCKPSKTNDNMLKPSGSQYHCGHENWTGLMSKWRITAEQIQAKQLFQRGKKLLKVGNSFDTDRRSMENPETKGKKQGRVEKEKSPGVCKCWLPIFLVNPD